MKRLDPLIALFFKLSEPKLYNSIYRQLHQFVGEGTSDQIKSRAASLVKPPAIFHHRESDIEANLFAASDNETLNTLTEC